MGLPNNLDELLKHERDITTDGKINMYSAKYYLRDRQKNVAIGLPENMNGNFLTKIYAGLSEFAESPCKKFDPVGKDDSNSYEFIPYENIRDKWEPIKQLIDNRKDFKENEALVPGANLSICELEFGNCTYYLCSKQVPLEKILKGKMVLSSANNELKTVSNSSLFLLVLDTDFIIRDEKNELKAFILNHDHFISFFKYDNHLKEQVRENIHILKEWKFFDGVDLILQKVEQKNVYRRLAKVFSDSIYLAEIQNTKPEELKQNLLTSSAGDFEESDFNGDKIHVTTKNMDKVMKMLSKSFRFNFFTNRAEET